MKRAKRLLTLVVISAMLLGTVPSNAFADPSNGYSDTSLQEQLAQQSAEEAAAKAAAEAAAAAQKAAEEAAKKAAEQAAAQQAEIDQASYQSSNWQQVDNAADPEWAAGNNQTPAPAATPEAGKDENKK